MKTSILSAIIITILFSMPNVMLKAAEPNETVEISFSSTASNLNNTEIEMLKHMREEEKLARDVYKYFYDKYYFFVFNNIMQSEQKHMDRLLGLLNQFNIPDPASKEFGVFNNAELQKLYNQLIAQGNQSLTEALKAGATIEDVDIKDLMEYRNATTNPNIISVLEKLTCGSRNHMRAFVKNLKNNNATYEPKYISQVTFDSIINGTHERCGQAENGKGKDKGKGKCEAKDKGKGKTTNKSKNTKKGNCSNK